MDKIAAIAGLLLIISFSGCSVAEGIFKAGFWVGILAVAFLVGIIVFFVSRSRK